MIGVKVSVCDLYKYSDLNYICLVKDSEYYKVDNLQRKSTIIYDTNPFKYNDIENICLEDESFECTEEDEYNYFIESNYFDTNSMCVYTNIYNSYYINLYIIIDFYDQPNNIIILSNIFYYQKGK